MQIRLAAAPVRLRARSPVAIPAAAILVLAALLGADPAASDQEPVAQRIAWIERDFDLALRRARIEKTPVLAYFHTSWCSWCVELNDKVFTDEDVIERVGEMVAVTIDGERESAAPLLVRYKVSSYPTILVLSPEGTVLGRLAAYRPAGAFVRFLDGAMTPGSTLTAIDAQIDAGDRSPALLLDSAERHFDAMEMEQAATRYEQVLAADPGGKAGAADDALLGLARVRLADGDGESALERYRQVLREHPQSDRLGEAFAGAIATLEREHRKADIGALFDEFASRFPDDPAVLNDRARRALGAGKDAAAALAAARRAVELSPRSADYRATLARALAASGQPEKAIEEIGRAIDIRPSDQALRLARLEILESLRKRPAPKR